jgi:hypothetical protein
MKDLLQEKIQMLNVSSELPEGHLMRFEDRLHNQLHATKKIYKFYVLYAVAASILLFICLNIFVFPKIHSNSELILAKESAEIVETEQYFQSEISQRMAVIKNLELKSTTPGDFKPDIVELDESLDKLKNDLKETPGDQRVVDAILNTYLLKIETLDNIVTILQKYS